MRPPWFSKVVVVVAAGGGSANRPTPAASPVYTMETSTETLQWRWQRVVVVVVGGIIRLDLLIRANKI